MVCALLHWHHSVAIAHVLSATYRSTAFCVAHIIIFMANLYWGMCILVAWFTVVIFRHFEYLCAGTEWLDLAHCPTGLSKKLQNIFFCLIFSQSLWKVFCLHAMPYSSASVVLKKFSLLPKLIINQWFLHFNSGKVPALHFISCSPKICIQCVLWPLLMSHGMYPWTYKWIRVLWNLKLQPKNMK